MRPPSLDPNNITWFVRHVFTQLTSPELSSLTCSQDLFPRPTCLNPGNISSPAKHIFTRLHISSPCPYCLSHPKCLHLVNIFLPAHVSSTSLYPAKISLPVQHPLIQPTLSGLPNVCRPNRHLLTFPRIEGVITPLSRKLKEFTGHYLKSQFKDILFKFKLLFSYLIPDSL